MPAANTLESWLLGFVLLVCLPSWAVADNAIPIASKERDGMRLVLFSHSAPVRAGMVSLSLMLLDAESGKPIMGWDARGTIEPVAVAEQSDDAWVAPCCRLAPGGDRNSPLPVRFTSGDGNVRFAAESSVILARPGTWRLALEINRPDGARQTEAFEINVASPGTPLSRYWPWFAAIPVVIVGYFFNRP